MLLWSHHRANLPPKANKNTLERTLFCEWHLKKAICLFSSVFLLLFTYHCIFLWETLSFLTEWLVFLLFHTAGSRRGPRQTAARGLQQKVQELQQAAQHWRLLQEPQQRQRRAPREQSNGAQRGGNPTPLGCTIPRLQPSIQSAFQII